MIHSVNDHYCEFCRFFDSSLVDDDGTGKGTCVRYAPRPILIPEPKYDIDFINYMVEEPRVGVRHWCGEWKSAPTKE